MENASRNISAQPIIVLLGLMGLMFLFSVSWPINSWFKAFLKQEQMRLPYLISFFALLLAASVILHRYFLKISMILLAAIGGAVGQFASMISILISNLLIPNGIEQSLKPIELFGLKDTLIGYSSFAFLLGGWVFGIVSFIALKLLMKKNILRLDS